MLINQQMLTSQGEGRCSGLKGTSILNKNVPSPHTYTPLTRKSKNGTHFTTWKHMRARRKQLKLTRSVGERKLLDIAFIS